MVIGTKVYFFLFLSPSLSRPSAITIPLLSLHAIAICMMPCLHAPAIMALWCWADGLLFYHHHRHHLTHYHVVE